MTLMKRGSKTSLVLVALAALLATSACAPTSGASTGSDVDVLRVGISADPKTLDPQWGSFGTEYPYLYALYDSLIDVDPNTLEPQPGLAKEWDQSDPQTLLLTLEEGVTFHDGEKFDAEAVKFNLERGKSEGSLVTGDLATVDSVEVTGEYEVAIHLTKPDTSMLLTLSDRSGMMVSPAAAETGGDDFGRHPVGTGPFVFDSWKPGSMVSVKKNDDYWKSDEPALDGIDFSIFTDASTALNAVKTDQLDIITVVPLQDVDTLMADDTLQVTVTPSLVSRCWYVNTNFAPLDSVEVRRAINMAIDRKGVLDTVMFGHGEESWTSFSSASWVFPEELVPTYEYDVDGAKALLAKAGYPDGISFTLAVTNDPASVRLAEVLKSQLAEAGIDMSLDVLEPTQQTQLFLQEKKYPAGLSGGVMRPDPARALITMFGPTVFNPGEVEVPGLAAAIDAANSTSDLDERREHIIEAQRLVADFAAFVPIVFSSAVSVSRTNVEGFVPGILDKPDFTQITLTD